MNYTYYLFDDLTRIKDVNPDLLKIDKKSYNDIDIYYTGCITIKDTNYLNTRSVYPLYLIFDEVDGYIKENNGNKYLSFVSNDKKKEVLTKYTNLWVRLKIWSKNKW